MRIPPVVFALAAAGAIAAGPAAFVTLPNGWRIAPPPGAVGTVGTLPTGIALSADGRRAFVLETGFGKPALSVLDAQSLAAERTIRLGNAYGAPLRDADGDGLWIANTAGFGEQIAHVDPAAGRIDREISLPIPFFASAIARSPDGRTLAIAGDIGGRVVFADPARAVLTGDGVLVGRHPAALLWAADGKHVYVADRAERGLDVIDVAARKVTGRIPVGLHPVALAASATRIYAADADDDDIAVIDPATGKLVARVPLPFARAGVVGASPNAIVVDGDRLYVTCGAANAVAVFRTAQGTLEPLGAIPAGWYPTGLAVDRPGNALLVVNAKGEGGHANPKYPADRSQYIAASLTGSVRRIPRPNDADLRRGLADVLTLDAPFANGAPPESPVVRARGPIAHVIYVIKENRSYDQVLGDVAAGDGDATLVRFGENVTPNEHALAARFGLFDRFFVNAHVSADGHNWSTAAFANDYLERMWPANYAQRRSFYDFEDGAEASVPHAGYLWDDAAAHHVTYRDYGEFVSAAPNENGIPVATMQRALQGHVDPSFPTYDLHITDVSRVEEWKREFDAFERNRTLPALEIVRLPRDHTAGTRVGDGTPDAMVADNDRAVGLLVDAVSHSADWQSTAVFVLEDDAQDGPDHVDEQRSILFIASPYAHGGLLHEQYTTASVLRTIELILGLPAMTPYDAGARPLAEAFTGVPDLRPFDALPAKVDLDAKNARTAYRAADSAKLDFSRADAADETILNDILRHSVAQR